MEKYLNLGISLRTIFALATLVMLVNANKGPIADKINSHQADFANITTKSLFNVRPTMSGSFESVSEGDLTGGTLLDRRPSIAGMAQEEEEDSEYMRFTIPLDNRNDITLQLYHVSIYADDAHVCGSDVKAEDCPLASQGSHYWGIVEDHPDDSIVSCSFTNHEVACVIQLGDDQYVLGNMGDQEVFYNTKQLNFTPVVGGSQDEYYADPEHAAEPPKPEKPEIKQTQTDQHDWSDLSAIYIHVDVEYKIYEYYEKDEVYVREWTEAHMAEVFVLYANEGITLKLQSIRIWTEPDPYCGFNPDGSGE